MGLEPSMWPLMLASLLSGFVASVGIGDEDDVGDIVHVCMESRAWLGSRIDKARPSPGTLYSRSSRGSDSPLHSSLALLTNLVVSHATQFQHSSKHLSIESLLCDGVEAWPLGRSLCYIQPSAAVIEVSE